MRLHCTVAFIALSFVLRPTSGLAAESGDPNAGQRLYRFCAVCHLLEPGRHITGPSLSKIWQRKTGTVKGFTRYSGALKTADVVWNARSLALSGAAEGTLVTYAQQRRQKVLRVGWVLPKVGSLLFWENEFKKRMVAFGYVEGKNVSYEIVRIPNFSKSELDPAYRELVRRNVDILVGWGPETAIRVAIAATRKVPIVIASPDFDPVASGLAKSYRTPGGNFTGIYAVQVELTPKRLQLMTEAFPGVKALTVFWDVHSADQWREAQAAAAKLNLDLFGVEFKKRPYDYESGFAPVPAKYRGHLLVLGSPAFAVPERRLLPDFALRQRLRNMFVFRNYVVAGGLMSYGASFSAIIQGAADYVDRIAKGAKPASLPIVQPTKFDFVVNLKTAKALGVTLPRLILLRATEVIK